VSGLRLDMHLHTAASFDCLSDPEAVLAAAAARGVTRICVTDHDTLDAARWLRRRHPAQVIVGEEVKTAERVDIIGLFLREEIPGGTPARETCLRIREQGGIVYVPHPFAGGKGGGGAILPEVADLVHAVEGFNGRIHDPALNERAVGWARERGLPLGAGSDAHTLAEVGGTHIRLPDFDIGDPAALLAALAHATLHGVAASRLVHLASTWAKVRKRLPGESTWTGTEQV